MLFLFRFLEAKHFRDVAKRIYFGSAISQRFFNESEYYRISSEEFNMLTAEREMKWDNTEPEPGHFTFKHGDELLAFAEKYKMGIRGHNFIWHEEVPDWVYSLDKESLRKHIKTRIM